MSATEELRRLLDEFEHECYMIRVEASETRARDDVVRKAYERQREKTAQEIAATLGGGKLTAEQVREAIFNGSSYASYDGAKYYADGIGMQAIADELNATLGCGECENANDVMKSGEIGFKCSECGSWDDAPQPRFCHNCGRKVKR